MYKHTLSCLLPNRCEIVTRERKETARETLNCGTSSESLVSSYIFHARLIQGRLSPRPRARAPKSLTAHCLPLTQLTDSSLLGVENFRRYIFFGSPRNSSNAIHVAFMLSFAYLKIQQYILF